MTDAITLPTNYKARSMKSITNLAAFIVLLISSSNTSSAFIPSVSAITPSTSKSKSFAKEPHTIFTTISQKLSQQQQRKATSLDMGSQGLVYGTAVATTFGMQLIGFVAAYGMFFHRKCSYDMFTDMFTCVFIL